jgi:hypothetical protein
VSFLRALSGCAAPDIAPKKIEQRVWPAMPDQPRFAFEATLQTQANIIPEPEDQRLQRMISGVAPNTRSGKLIGKPSGIAVRDGRIYVAEPGVKAVTVLDAARGKMFRFGLRPPNTLERPQALALDDEGMAPPTLLALQSALTARLSTSSIEAISPTKTTRSLHSIPTVRKNSGSARAA